MATNVATWSRMSNEVGATAAELEAAQMEELIFLSNAFSSSSATALQRGSQGDWIRLREFMQILQPVGKGLLQFSEVQHYIQRIAEHVTNNQESLGGLRLIELLAEVFAGVKHEKSCINYPSGDTETPSSTSKELHNAAEKSKQHKTAERSAIDNSINNNHDKIFSMRWQDIEEKLKPNELSLIDIQRYLPRVLSEISKHEAVWKDALGLTLVAANTEIPYEIEKEVKLTNTSKGSPLVSFVEESHFPVPRKQPKNGFAVVESLVRDRAVDVTNIYYLNFADTRHYSPYDLKVVSRKKINPEHYVISVFGALHVKPGGNSELKSLGKWYRQATVYKTIKKRPFFRNYLIFKTFMLWKKNMKFIKFMRARKQLKEKHLLEVPSMTVAILKVMSFLSEMERVDLFPTDVDNCFTLEKFNHVVHVILKNAKKLTDKLYSHCQMNVSVVESDCLEYLQYCQFQLEQKTDNIKESMTLARQRRNLQLKNFGTAKYVFEQKLPCFVVLVEEVLHQFMLALISEKFARFVHEVMNKQREERKGLFSAEFQFDVETNLLVLSPRPESFLRSLRLSFENVPAVLSEVCVPMLLQLKYGSEDTLMIKEIDGNRRLTADELRILLNCGAKEANETLKQSTDVDGRRQSSGNEQIQPLLHVEPEFQDNDASGVSRQEALQERLAANKMVQDCTNLMNSLMTTAFKEVETFAEEHKWIAAIHKFVITWNSKTMQSWKGQTASKIEKQVQQIKTWIDQVRRVDKSMKTSNGILFVDGSEIQQVLVPGLRRILKGMMDMIANHCLLSSEQLITELYDISKSLSTKTSTIEEFTALFQRLKECKEKAVSLQNRVEYVSSIYEVVRHCYRQLNSDEENTEERLSTEYNSFLYFMQDANNYVNSLTPQMLENLEKNISSLEYEAMEITEKVTSGKFLDADENPKDILPELKELHMRFAEIKDQLLKLVICEDIIKDEPHDLTALSSMQARIVARHELWKYCEVTTYTIKDWMQTPFTKLQTKKVVEKVTKWREAVVKLKRDIPSEDEVLCSWIAKIEDFGIDLPLLLEMSSVSLKARHWRWLFAGLGQVYDQSYNYLVIDLVSFGLRDHSQQVVSICDSVAAEYALEAHLKKLTKRWEEEEFRLMKYFQVSRQSSKVKDTVKNKSKLSHDMFILTGVNELQSHVEDNLVTLQSMLVSPFLAEMRGLAETWSGYLHQLKLILDLWISCQQKWLYLEKIFNQSTLNLKLSQQRKDFGDVDAKFREHMAAVLKDPKVLSVLEKKRADKGYRELQGDTLRELFVGVIAKEEKIIKCLDRYLDNVRASFPRLYFLSDSEMLELLAISRDPKALVPFVSKCFPGIVNLKFMLPQALSSTVRTQLDASLNAHRLEVTCFYGQCGEEMNLAKTIQPTDSVEDWLCSIEYAMKSILWNKMARCFEERFLNTPSITKLLTSIGILQKGNDANTEMRRQSSARKRLQRVERENAYWFIVHPFQCVLAAEEVLWATNMAKALDPKGFQSISDVRTLVDDAITQYSSALQSNLIPESEDSLSKRAIMLIQALLVRALYHQEMTKDLDKPGVDESSFEWLQCLKYQIEISHDKRRRVYDRHRKAKLIYGASNTAKFGMLRTNQMELSLPYGYEYRGPTTRLAITPLTDRALLNLMAAMKLHYTGGVFGPTQTGKTGTMHEVSKMLGSNFVTFKCNPSLSISKILHFIAGAIQSGSLICLESITLLPHTILSVLGQHLDCTRQALGSLERRAFSQFETRDANVARRISQENFVKRRRGITVISLHTMTVRDALVDMEVKENEEVRPIRDRRHSIAEIIHITDPRKPADTKTSHLKESRSEMKISKRHSESNDENDYQKIKPLGNVMLGGHLMEASPLFGCFMTIKTTKNHYESIPDNLLNAMRLVSTVLPDYEILIETFLLSNGFKNHHKLAKKLACFRELLRDEFLGDAVYTMSLVQVKAIIIFAGKGCRQMKVEKLYANAQDQEKLPSPSVLEGKIEESCLGQAIHTLMFSAINPLDITNFIRLLKVSFPACKDCISENKQADALLLSSVRQQIGSDSLLDKDEFVNKVMQLHETMFLNRSVILLGSPASGKSACYQTLCRALCQFYSAWTQAVKIRRQKLNNEKGDVAEENTSFSKVNLSTIYHKAMTNEELFGEFSKTSQSWSDGLLPKFLRTASKLQHDSKEDGKTCDTIQYWFVFDGPLDRKLTDPLESLLDNKNELCLINGERIKPPDSVRFLFETTNLADSSPAIISRSAIVNFEKGLLDWRCLLCSWRKSARTKFDISNTGIKVVESMLEHIDEPLADFLSNDAEPLLTKKYASITHNAIASCLPEISSILQLLAAILERCTSRQSHERSLISDSSSILSDAGSTHSRSNVVKETEEIKFISNAFAYAFVWAVGGRLHERCYPKFDMFSRQLFATCPYSIIFPCTVFDAVFDYTEGELTRWQGNTADVPKTMPSQNYVVCPEIERYFTIADLLLMSGSHVLIAGEQGVGKTAFVKNLLQPRQRLQQILISQGLTSQYFQQKIQRHVQENQNRFRSNPMKAPPQQQKGLGTNKSLFFIDDVSLAAFDSHCKNAQPTLEVLRQMISEGGIYHQERQYFQHLPNLQFLAACIPPDGYGKGGPNRELSPRLTRRMNMINMMPLSDESLSTIYTSVYKAWLEEFPAYSLTHIDPLAKALAYASVDMYAKIKEKFSATPTNPQYVFSHHDLARIAKGVFIYSPKSRLRARKSGHGFAKGDLSVNQSMPDLQIKNSVATGLPDPSLSVVDLQAYLNKHNIDQTPASVSPLIRIIIRLWCHETCRSFYDRIINTEDKKWFATTLQKTVVVKFCGEKPSLVNKQGIMSREASTVDKKNSKNRVKFKDIESTRQADYHGPLISLKHLMGDDQALATITFSKHLFIYGTRGIEGAGEHEKGYVECLDHHLEEALRKSLNLIKTTEGERLDLVLYKEALYHAARISRVLSMPGGHALLVSLNGHGRANIVKLVAKLANIKIMTVSECALKNQTKFRSILKDACYVAGLLGKPIIVYVPEGLSKEGMQDVAAMLVEGTCPGLYTPEELIAIGNHLLPGGQVGQRRTENKMVAQERFLRRIRSNIHIVICAMHLSLNTIVKEYPSVLSRAACVDFYNEWSVDILKEVAERWLIAKGKNEFFYKVPWNLDERDRQLTAIYDVMANIHLSSRAALDKDFRRLGLEVFSPLKFVELIDMFRTLCNVICNEREEELSQLTRATDKVKEGKKYIEDTEKSISELTPVLEKARLALKTADAEVKLATNKYHDSKEACADQQNEIEKLKIPLQRLNDEAKEQFGKVTPLYEAATATLQSLSIYVVEEVRSYRSPPEGVKFVTDTLCLMFGKEASWEVAKRLLIRENFFYDLLFYNKDEVSDWLFKKLEIYYKSENSDPKTLSSISQAARLFSVWIRTVYEYCRISRLLRPKQLEILEAENKLKKARALLGKLRVDSHHLKIELENAIEIYKDCLKETKSLEKQFQTLNRAKKKAAGLIESMSMYNSHWQERIDILKKKLQTAPGDALLTSAIICYLSTFEDDKRDELMRGWMDYCKDGVGSEIPIDKEFSILNLLSSDEELVGWTRKDMPTDLFSLTNALVLRTTCIASKKCWPLLIDRNDQGIAIVKCLEEGMSKTDFRSESSSSDRKDEIAKRTITSAIMNQKSSADQGRITARSMRGNFHQASIQSEGFRRISANDGRFSAYSLADERDSVTTRTSDHSDSRISLQRPYSSFSAITNESAFLKKFYVKTGLREEPESLPDSPILELQEEVLMVVEVDDADLNRKLRAAIANGLPTLVTHIERGIQSLLLALIIGRSISVSDDGTCYLICGKKRLYYNPNFRLYLSAAVSMNFNKTNRFVLPLHKVFIVNMAVSQEGLSNKLIEMTILSERPSLESPRRSLELDLFYLRKECKQIHDRVLNKIIEMPGKVLEERSLPELMSETKEQLRVTHERMKEVQQFKDDLENKRQGYYEVAYHGSMLYRVVAQITELEPYYEIPLYFFAEIFKKTLKEARRLKTESGSVAARAAEINAQFTLDVYKRICLNVFKEHAPLYPILVTAFTLMRQKELGFEHYKMFLELCSMSGSENMTQFDLNIPDEACILTEEVQARVSALESLPGFTGLADSMRKHPSEWKEYLEISPNLVTSCPLEFKNLGTFHKALIWLALMPRKREMTCQSLILCSLGPTFTEVGRHNLDTIYHESTSVTPILVLLPETAQNILGEDPAISIEAFGKAWKVQVVTISLGLPQQLSEAIRAIKDAIKDDNKWVLLQNCDLESEWSQDFLRLIEEITATTDDENSCFSVEEKPNNSKRLEQFRLWMIFKCNEGLTIPIALIKKGLQVAWDEKIVAHGSEVPKVTTAQKALSDLYQKTLGKCETYGSTLPYFGTTSQLKYGKEVFSHLCSKVGRHKIRKERNQSYIPCILDEFVFGPAYTTSNALTNLSSKEDSKQEQNMVSEGKDVERLHLERDFLESAKAMITLVDDSRKASLEKKTNAILEEISSKIQLIHESLSKKTMCRSLKSINHFFYREITFLRTFCDMILRDLNGIQDSTDGGSSVLPAIKEGIVPDHWQKQLRLRSSRIEDWLQEISTLCNSLQSHIRPKSRQPIGYDVSLIPHAKGFFASLIEDFCNENLADIGNVELIAEVLQEKDNTLPPMNGVYLKNISVQNAAWDFDQGQLRLEMMSVSQLPILHVIPQLRPKEFSKDGATFIACPLVWFEGSEIACLKMKSNFDQETVRIENIQFVSNSM